LEPITEAASSVVGSKARVADLFTGTTVVAQALAAAGHRLTAIDTQRYAIVFADALLGVKRKLGEPCLADRIEFARFDSSNERLFEIWQPFVEREDRALELGDILALRKLYDELPLVWRDGNSHHVSFSSHSERSAIGKMALLTSIYAGTYFGVRQALLLDRLRHAAEARRAAGALSGWQFNAVLTAVMSAASAAVHSAGKHFAQPLGAGSSQNHSFLNKRLLEDRAVSIFAEFDASCSRIELDAAPSDSGHVSERVPAEVFVESSTEPFDLFYLDPPYTAQQYTRFYHLLETLVTYEYPDLLHGRKITSGLYPRDRYKSAFSSRAKAAGALHRIVRSARQQGTSLLISYSGSARDSQGNARMITLEELLQLCRDEFGSASVDWSRMNHRYRQFNSAANSNTRRDDSEILITCKRR
jgi:hypothetical protein